MEEMKPKWVLTTKRGIGMLMVVLASVMPVAGAWVKAKWGWEVDAPMVAVFGERLYGVVDAVALVSGFVLWVWGSFRPTAPLSVTPVSE